MTWLQASCAVATPVAFVVVTAGHSSTTSEGHVRVGFVVSRIVIVWTQLALLPQASVAVQVREMILEPPQVLLTASAYMTTTWLQVSDAVATPVALVEVLAGHSSTTLGGQVMTGLMISRTVIV